MSDKPKPDSDSASEAVGVVPTPEVEAGLRQIVIGSRLMAFAWILINGFDLLWLVVLPSLEPLRGVVVSVGAIALLAGIAMNLWGSRTPVILILVALGICFAAPQAGNVVFLLTLLKGSKVMQEYGWNALKGPPQEVLPT